MKKIIGALLLVATLILSGCTEKPNDDTQSNVVDSSANVNTNIESDTTIDNIGSEEQISVEDDGAQLGEDNANTGEWCTPESKIMENDKEYTVIGLTVYEDKGSVCKAERPVQGGSSVIHFNREYINKESGAFFSEKTVSTGENARAEASSSVSVTGK